MGERGQMSQGPDLLCVVQGASCHIQNSCTRQESAYPLFRWENQGPEK